MMYVNRRLLGYGRYKFCDIGTGDVVAAYGLYAE